MDTETEELKELVRASNKLAEDTNKVVHSMRRSMRFTRLLRLLWWAAIIGISSAAYLLYFQPYVAQVLQFYNNTQDLFQNFRPQ